MTGFKSLLTGLLAATLLLSAQVGAYPSGEQVFRWKIPGSGGANSNGGLLLPNPAGGRWGSPSGFYQANNWRYDGLTVEGPADASGTLPVTKHFTNEANGRIAAEPDLLSAAAVGSKLRSRVLSSAGASIASTMTTAGYTIDAANQSINLPGSTQVVPLGWCGGLYLPSDTTTLAQCPIFMETTFVSGGCSDCSALRTPIPVEDTPGLYRNFLVNASGPFTYWYWQEDSSYGTTTETVPGDLATDADLADWAYANLTTGELQALFYDPDTGAPLPL